LIYFITGKAGSGKTVYAYRLKVDLMSVWWKFKPIVILDGDDVRKHFPTGFTDEDRERHIMHIAKIAALLEAQGVDVIIALVSPKKEWRQKARKLFKKSKLIYMEGGTLWKNTTYEEPDAEELA